MLNTGLLTPTTWTLSSVSQMVEIIKQFIIKVVFTFQQSDVIGEGVLRTVPKLGANQTSLFLKSGTLDTGLLSTKHKEVSELEEM